MFKPSGVGHELVAEAVERHFAAYSRYTLPSITDPVFG
jgi:hypothetical protein